eukprot:1217206-Pyramimonas_sp.AAC.1
MMMMMMMMLMLMLVMMMMMMLMLMMMMMMLMLIMIMMRRRRRMRRNGRRGRRRRRRRRRKRMRRRRWMTGRRGRGWCHIPSHLLPSSTSASSALRGLVLVQQLPSGDHEGLLLVASVARGLALARPRGHQRDLAVAADLGDAELRRVAILALDADADAKAHLHEATSVDGAARELPAHRARWRRRRRDLLQDGPRLFERLGVGVLLPDFLEEPLPNLSDAAKRPAALGLLVMNVHHALDRKLTTQLGTVSLRHAGYPVEEEVRVANHRGHSDHLRLGLPRNRLAVSAREEAGLVAAAVVLWRYQARLRARHDVLRRLGQRHGCQRPEHRPWHVPPKREGLGKLLQLFEVDRVRPSAERLHERAEVMTLTSEERPPPFHVPRDGVPGLVSAALALGCSGMYLEKRLKLRLAPLCAVDQIPSLLDEVAEVGATKPFSTASWPAPWGGRGEARTRCLRRRPVGRDRTQRHCTSPSPHGSGRLLVRRARCEDLVLRQAAVDAQVHQRRDGVALCADRAEARVGVAAREREVAQVLISHGRDHAVRVLGEHGLERLLALAGLRIGAELDSDGVGRLGSTSIRSTHERYIHL